MSNRNLLIKFLPILLIIAIDQFSKYYVVHVLNLGHIGVIELSPFLDFTMVWNGGISFGTFQASSMAGRWILVALSSSIVCFMSFWLAKTESKLTIWALIFVIGGAIGNIIDRIYYGVVADFIDISALNFPWIFNLADSAVVLGAFLLIIETFRNPKSEA